VILTPEELEAFTLKPTPRRQMRVLDFLGVKYRPRPDGTLIVLRIHAYGPQDIAPVRREPQLRLSQ
jgi:hypothetical protein